MSGRQTTFHGIAQSALVAAVMVLGACTGSFGATETAECTELDFTCGDGSCVPIGNVCNGRDNCSDGADEANCIQKCENRSDYRCKDGVTCLAADEVCDGRADCPGADDEATCSTTECDGFQCRDGACIDPTQKCDGKADCLLAEDEAPGLCSPTRCDETDYRCTDGKTCVTAAEVCDGKEQCPEGDDEAAKQCGNETGETAPDEGDDKDEDEGEGRPPTTGETPGKPGENSPDEGRPCVSIDEKGICDGPVLSWCDNGQVEKRDCAREGKICGEIDADHGNTCLATENTPAPTSECGDVSAAGSCNGDNLIFCSRGKVRIQQCGRRGQTCVPEGERFRCGGVATGETDTCGGATETGTCEGDKLVHCKDNQRVEYDCAATGMSCEQGASGASCEANECGDLTYEGECNGATLSYCHEGARKIEIDCAADYGLGCGFVNGEIGFACKPDATTDSCGDVTYEGECDGTSLKWCEDGQVYEADCADYERVCGDADDNGTPIKSCLTPADACGDITFEGECQGDTAVWCNSGALQSLDCSAAGKGCGFVSDEVGYYCTDEPTSAANSCEDRCDTPYDSAMECQCDESCIAIGDCCDDFSNLCQ